MIIAHDSGKGLTRSASLRAGSEWPRLFRVNGRRDASDIDGRAFFWPSERERESTATTSWYSIMGTLPVSVIGPPIVIETGLFGPE